MLSDFLVNFEHGFLEDIFSVMFIASIGQDKFPYIRITCLVDMSDDLFLPLGYAPDDLYGGILFHLYSKYRAISKNTHINLVI